jgi:phage shock protein PspC (stress-responsive transcriptional regulator)
MTTNEPNNPEPGVPRRPVRVERSRSDRVLGGVCAGIARSLGVDPVLVRIAVVLIGLVSGGAAVLAYLVAWVLLPQPAEEPQREPRASTPPAGGAKEAWSAVGGELKALAAELRPKQASDEAAAPSEDTPSPSKRPSLHSVDAALTGFGDRLRTPEVQEGARRTLAGLSAAVDASVEEIGSRVRRDRSEPEASAPGESDRPRPEP